jgi:hypothetical protein
MAMTAPIQDVDSLYLERTLRHEPIEPDLGDTVSLRALISLTVRAGLASAIFLTLFVTLWIVTGGLSSVANPTGAGNTGLLAVALISSFAVFWLALLVARTQEPVGEWRVLLADRWEYSGSVYSAVAGVLAARALPIRPTARRIYADPAARQVKNFLELRDGQYAAHVTVFPYGSSLYLGWMMWRRRSGASLLGRALADLVSPLFGTPDPARAMLNSDRPRALREAVHAACREGVYSAVRQEMVADNFGFPNGLPPVEAYHLAPPPPPPTVPGMPQPTGPIPPNAAAPGAQPPTPFGQATAQAPQPVAPVAPPVPSAQESQPSQPFLGGSGDGAQ